MGHRAAWFLHLVVVKRCGQMHCSTYVDGAIPDQGLLFSSVQLQRCLDAQQESVCGTTPPTSNVFDPLITTNHPYPVFFCVGPTCGGWVQTVAAVLAEMEGTGRSSTPTRFFKRLGDSLDILHMMPFTGCGGRASKPCSHDAVFAAVPREYGIPAQAGREYASSVKKTKHMKDVDTMNLVSRTRPASVSIVLDLCTGKHCAGEAYVLYCVIHHIVVECPDSFAALFRLPAQPGLYPRHFDPLWHCSLRSTHRLVPCHPVPTLSLPNGVYNLLILGLSNSISVVPSLSCSDLSSSFVLCAPLLRTPDDLLLYRSLLEACRAVSLSQPACGRYSYFLFSS